MPVYLHTIMCTLFYYIWLLVYLIFYRIEQYVIKTGHRV